MATWAILSSLAFVSVLILSGTAFCGYYAWPTYEKWRYKINPKFPSPEDVRCEIMLTLKGIATASFPPTLSLWLSQHGYSQAYCGVGDMGWGYLLLSGFMIWILTDFWSWGYHYCGHYFTSMWAVHRHHHKFHNPSPFAVIADEPLDQVIRALPMVLFPMLAPTNMDLMFFQFGVLFYAYGVYLHWGYDMEWPNAHTPFINTSYQHFAHHQLSIMNKPYHTGFFFKIWDDLAGSVYPKEKCFCSQCARAKGEREREQWEKVEKPDYSPLLSPSFWLQYFQKDDRSKRTPDSSSLLSQSFWLQQFRKTDGVSKRVS